MAGEDFNAYHNAKRLEGGRRLRSSFPRTPPLVSIVVVVFRARQQLPPVLDSIFAMESAEVEVVVVDGGSDDGTVELLQEYDNRIDYWLSEPDNGIYHAMNKALAACTGEYVLHLNAGDKLRSLPIGRLRHFSAEKADVVSCQVLMDERVVYSPRTGFRMMIENTWHHQGTFYRRLTHPKYNEDYRVYGDFDLNQRITKQRRDVRLLAEVVAEHSNDGISVRGRSRYAAELWKSVKANSGPMYVPIAFVWYKLYFLRKQVASLRRLFSSRLRA
jgi:glycosyltransferase involved in cell wall biosynthesis